MARGNRAIRDHQSDGRELHLFEKSDQSGYYTYLGQFRYVSHQVRQGEDLDGDQRSQIVFKLELVQEAPTAQVGHAEQSAAAQPRH